MLFDWLATLFLPLLLLILAASGCSVNAQYSDERRVIRAEKQFKARDACLKRNAEAIASTSEDVSIAAAAVAESCKAETQKLNDIVNVPRETEISTSIHRDSVFRATGFILKAQGTPSAN